MNFKSGQHVRICRDHFTVTGGLNHQLVKRALGLERIADIDQCGIIVRTETFNACRCANCIVNPLGPNMCSTGKSMSGSGRTGNMFPKLSQTLARMHPDCRIVTSPVAYGRFTVERPDRVVTRTSTRRRREAVA